ncbi:MAG: hypothetical protein ACI80V_000276 [Rhodothermales bacterium]
MAGDYTLLIIGTTIGFGMLAAILLVPVYRFMKKEDEMLSAVTKEELEAEARRRDRQESV